jgi:hypothetical protein
MRSLFPLLLALLSSASLAAAGCLDGGGDGRPATGGPTTSDGASSSAPPAPPAPGPPVVDLLLGFSFQGCEGMSVRQALDVDRLQPLLPAGFQAKVVENSDQVPPASRGFGTIALDLYRCGNLTATNAVVPDTYYGQVYTLIERPVDRVPGAPDAVVNEYVFRVLAGEDVLADLWPAASYETRSGAASVEVGPPQGLPLAAGPRTGQGAVAGYTWSTVGNTPVPSALTGRFARYTALNDGSVLVWTGTYSFAGAYGGSGNVQVPGDDPFEGFQAADGTGLNGAAMLVEGGSMDAMDLRRVFTPP